MAVRKDILYLPFGFPPLDERGKTALISLCIGFWSCTGLIIAIFVSVIRPFGFYMLLLGIFHFLEYFFQVLYNPLSTNTDGFLINHSKEYITALFLSCLEYFLFFYNSPYIKSFHWISFLGLFISLCGQFLRTAAIICAGSNFTHQISSGQKQANHRLVTSGVYKISRHPSYLGWFLWYLLLVTILIPFIYVPMLSLGSQILLSNPLCFVGFLIVSLKFFKERIELEEFWLVLFFGEDYEAYRERVPSRIPFLDSILNKKK